MLNDWWCAENSIISLKNSAFLTRVPSSKKCNLTNKPFELAEKYSFNLSALSFYHCVSISIFWTCDSQCKCQMETGRISEWHIDKPYNSKDSSLYLSYIRFQTKHYNYFGATLIKYWCCNVGESMLKYD